MAARVRMFLKADLGWLSGYPLSVDGNGVRWACSPANRANPEATLVVDRQAIHRSSRTFSKATRRYHKALPAVVADAKQWARRVTTILEALKPAVHDGQPCPPSLLHLGWSPQIVEEATELTKSHHQLAPLLNALSWSLFLEVDRLPSLVSHLKENAPKYASILDSVDNLPLAVRLCWLAEKHGELVAPLLRALAENRRHSIPTRCQPTASPSCLCLLEQLHPCE